MGISKVHRSIGGGWVTSCHSTHPSSESSKDCGHLRSCTCLITIIIKVRTSSLLQNSHDKSWMV